jgi:TATA-binding protein-associated factor Taf7
MVLVGEDTQEAQQLPQNNNHDNDHEGEENNEEEEEEGNKAEGEDDEEYTHLSDVEKDETYRDADEIKTAGNEAPILTSRLRDLLKRLNIITPPEFRIKRVMCLG